MKIFRRRKFNRPYEYSVTRTGSGDFEGKFLDGVGNQYIVDFEWYSNSMDIEFRVVGYGHSTTNSNCQYRVMKTIGFIYRDIVDNSDNQLDNITFKSSYLRDGKTDINAGVVRTNFFIRFLKSLYPNARIFENSGGVIRADITYPWVN